ncbi:alpha/beta hydrolase [Ammoniphilus sp. 3BR4]|uniref:alpha/beta hydrolase n=1 Tax=Ammoniphilus sp. 3BR4 TaxID=3158265 RepID=UPI0034676FB3
MVFFHGGGFIMGSVEGHDEKVRPLAMESGYKVISLDYRLAPEHPFPAALNEVRILHLFNRVKWRGSP